MLRTALALLLLTVPSMAGPQPLVIENDDGGFLRDYVGAVARIRSADNYFAALAKVVPGRSFTPVIIRGRCASGCTLHLTNPHTCVHRTAKLMFHAVRILNSDGTISPAPPETTRWLLEQYPPKVQRWIKSKGGLTKKLIVLQGREMRKIVPICS